MHGCLNANPFYQNWSQGIGYHTNNRLCSIIGWACNTDHLNYPPHYSGHNERGDVSNHQRLDCLLNRLFRGITKKTSKLRITGLSEGNSLVTVEFPAQKPMTWKMFPFDDVIMNKPETWM